MLSCRHIFKTPLLSCKQSRKSRLSQHAYDPNSKVLYNYVRHPHHIVGQMLTITGVMRLKSSKQTSLRTKLHWLHQCRPSLKKIPAKVHAKNTSIQHPTDVNLHHADAIYSRLASASDDSQCKLPYQLVRQFPKTQMKLRQRPAGIGLPSSRWRGQLNDPRIFPNTSRSANVLQKKLHWKEKLIHGLTIVSHLVMRI